MNENKLKFLIDVNVGKKVETYLEDKGYDVKTIRSINSHMPDKEIIQLAAIEKRMVVTMDKDFGELVYHSGLGHYGILLLRLENAAGTKKVEVVHHILENYSEQIINAFCVYQNEKLRIRKK